MVALLYRRSHWIFSLGNFILLKMCTASPELFKVVLCFKSWKHEGKKEEKKTCYKAFMSIFYEFFVLFLKVIIVTGYPREERMKVVQFPFQEVTKLPSLITVQRKHCRVFRKNLCFLKTLHCSLWLGNTRTNYVLMKPNKWPKSKCYYLFIAY